MDGLYFRIDELCRKNGITVTKLCKDTAIPRATLSDYKMGRIKSLSTTVVVAIAEYFSVSIDYLLGKHTTADEVALKAALFGGNVEVSDEMWNEVKRYALYISEKKENGN